VTVKPAGVTQFRQLQGRHIRTCPLSLPTATSPTSVRCASPGRYRAWAPGLAGRRCAWRRRLTSLPTIRCRLRIQARLGKQATGVGPWTWTNSKGRTTRVVARGTTPRTSNHRPTGSVIPYGGPDVLYSSQAFPRRRALSWGERGCTGRNHVRWCLSGRCRGLPSVRLRACGDGCACWRK